MLISFLFFCAYPDLVPRQLKIWGFIRKYVENNVARLYVKSLTNLGMARTNFCYTMTVELIVSVRGDLVVRQPVKRKAQRVILRSPRYNL